MKRNWLILLSLILQGILAHATDVPLAVDTDIDEDLQGDPTTVTRFNNCVKVKEKAFNPILGTVPLIAGSLPSSDLVCDSEECGPGIREGDILTSFQAQNYFNRRFEETRCQWTLADLEPQEDPSIWENKVGGELDKSLDNIDIKDLDTVEYVSKAWGRIGSFRVTVNKNNEFGVPVQYSLYLSKRIHNYILRTSLLRKLGYKVPPMKWVKRVKIKFPSEEEMELFKSELGVNNAGSFDRWVLNSTDDNELVVQDVLLADDQEYQMNLAKGIIEPSLAEGKRIYHSLLIPFALVEAPESINMFDWTYGRVYSDNLIVQHPAAAAFDISYHDAIWMTRRMLKLKESDWWEIVDSTSLPASVKLLLFEKLKSRVNHLAHLMGQNYIEMPVNSKVSNQKDLLDGEITQEFYDGYARRFKIPDPESPIAGNRLLNFFKSKGISMGIESLMTVLNSQDFMGTDISGNIEEKINEIQAKAALEGNVGKLPVKGYVFPTVKGSVIVDREVMAGGYLGTDETRLQIADSVGAIISVGAFGGLTGIYSETGEEVDLGDEIVRQKVPVNISANAKVGVSRVYTHVRPILSIEQGLDYPYKNMFVPYIMKQQGDVFGDLMGEEYQDGFNPRLEGESYEMYSKRKSDALSKMIEHLNDNISVGESIIITDSLVADMSLNVGVNLYEVADLKLGMKPAGLIINRVHILRKSETEYHIYKSLGNVASIELSAGLQKYVPLTKIIYTLKTGVATTKYYKLNLGLTDENGNDNPYRNEYINGINSVLRHGSLQTLNNIRLPYEISHNFDSESNKFGIFVWRWNNLEQNDNMVVKDPEGKKMKFFRRMEGNSSGRDYESYSKDVLKALVGELIDVNFNFNSFRGGNTGYSFHGKAKNVVASYEAIETPDNRLISPLIKLSRVYNGWKISGEDAIEKIKDINWRYKFDYFNPDSLAQTKSIYFYNINVNFFVKPEGLTYISNLKDRKLAAIWERYKRYAKSERRFKRLRQLVRSYRMAVKKKKKERMAELALAIVKTLENNLTQPGFSAMFGGGRNTISLGRIDGYRDGDENGDESIYGNSTGRIGSEGLSGPIGDMQKELGASSGEFFLSWILGRVL